MTATIVFGVYDFLGLHLCNHFLNEGNEVVGLQWMDQYEDEREEKELLFGRNVNFTFLQEFTEENFKEQCLVCLNLYDLIRGRFDAFQSMKEDIKKVIKQLVDHQIIILLPDDKHEKEMSKWIEEIKEIRDTIRWIRIADLYGPWQDGEFAAQQLLTYGERENVPVKASRLIYIDDFLSEWDMIMKDHRNELVVMGELHGECVQRKMEENVIIIQVKTSLSEALDKLHSYNEKRKH